jgi:hypothetical protein
MSAINLANAPTVTKNSKHIFQRHHFIRTMVKQKIVTIQHLPTADMTADLLTKAMPPKLFLRLRDNLMNSPSVPQATHTATLAGGCQLDTTTSSILPIGMLGVAAGGTSPTVVPKPFRNLRASSYASSLHISIYGGIQDAVAYS